MNGRTLWKRFIPLLMLLVVVLVGGSPAGARAGSQADPPRPVPAQDGADASVKGDAAIQSCYGSAENFSRNFTAWTWTGWYTRTTTSNCADLNVAVTDVVAGEGCDFLVDAQYYKRSEGRWIDGANDDFWMLPGYWYTPLTALLDGTQVRVRFQPSCTTSGFIWLAY